VIVAELTDEQRKLIDELAGSVSKLCHAVIRRRLEQFFEVIGEEVTKERARLMDALNREPGESLLEWETRARATRKSIVSEEAKP
jgi:beta-lactamase class A